MRSRLTRHHLENELTEFLVIEYLNGKITIAKFSLNHVLGNGINVNGGECDFSRKTFPFD